MSWNQPSLNQPPNQEVFVPVDARDERVGAFLSRVYGWMFLGLLITAGTAFFVASSGLVVTGIAFWGLIIAQLGLVFYLSARVEHIAPVTASLLFIVYSGLTGVTSSVILLAYTGASIAQTFIIAGTMFGTMAFFGTVTKRSLAGVGQFFFMGLIGIVIAMVVNIFLQSNALQFVISVIGVLVFTGLTAWDAQRLKQLAVALPEGKVGSYAVVGALSLYLDFINLFFFLLHLTGGRRD
ncbi:MAG TPA: Bax inhibitor-1/YccA family protein [Pyrinomonadaceae bacterium]|nr:Bax inhibitor-1/YccA family protein [Pyrinomonadaceae bacterium]